MKVKRACFLAALVAITAPAWAEPQDAGKSVKGSAPAATPVANPIDQNVNQQANPAVDPATGLRVRRPLPQHPLVKPQGESRLMVKFTDAVQARALADDGMVTSRAGADLTQLQAVAAQFNLQFTPAIHDSEAALRTLEQRAAARSGKLQPDLAGMMYVTGPEAVLQTAANRLQQLDCVEYAAFQLPYQPMRGDNGACCVPNPDLAATVCVDDVSEDTCTSQGGQFQGAGSTCAGLPLGCGTLGACCLEDDCEPFAEAACTGLGGAYQGDNSNCVLDEIDCDNAGCGAPIYGTCFLPHDGVGGNPLPSPFCDNMECCDLVGAARPFCVDEEVGNWDELCVAIAHLICEAPPADRCASFINGSCFEVHGIGGCIDSVCCNAVCDVDPFCCTDFWDQGCVELAEDLCVNTNGSGPTPDFRAQQGYLRQTSYFGQPDGPPGGLQLPAPTFFGYRGDGLFLFHDSQMFDNPVGQPTSVRFAGLYGLSRELFERYHVGTSALGRGQGIKVAVIEWACFKDHEDINVIPEPGQTMILIPDVGFPDHATACLGIIGARDNVRGVTGIAPDCQLYFFPLTSVEEGPREMTAFTHAIQTLDAGDVISCSFGPGPVVANLNNDATIWPLLRLAADLGITTCIAAGNDCFNLDDAPSDLGDSGAIVVGAGSPGRPHYRLTFSNHFETGTNADNNVVHMQSWGESVTTLAGNANLRFPGGDWNRSYTNSFNGTSAAAPQIAGVVACMQGLAKQFYDVPLMPEQIRAAIQATGYPQQGVQDPDNLPGFEETAPCGFDSDPDEEPNKIGPYPRPNLAGAFILNQSNVGFDGAPLVDDVQIIRGTHVFGNKFSVKGSDNNYLVVDSLFTPREHVPNLPSPINQVQYMATAQTADILIKGHVDAITGSIQVNTEVRPIGPGHFMFIEAYDWVARTWRFVNFVTLDNITDECAPDQCDAHLMTAAQRFIDPSRRQVFVRIYMLRLGGIDTGLGGSGTSISNSPFTSRIDLVSLLPFQGFGTGGNGRPDAGP